MLIKRVNLTLKNIIFKNKTYNLIDQKVNFVKDDVFALVRQIDEK